MAKKMNFEEQYIKNILDLFNECPGQTHELGEVEEIMVTMRDGVKLKTTIHFPKGEGPWPTLFTRTPYPIFGRVNKVIGNEYAKRGFIFISQFCRGTEGSEGEWVPNDNERNDGIDSINWIADQQWSKNIGIHGLSYMALTGWIIADQLPEKVKALYLSHYGIDRHLSAYKDGLFRHDILTGWAMQNAGNTVSNNFQEDYIKASLYRPHVEVDEKLWNVRLNWYRDWITNTDYDSEYWQSGFWKTLRDIPEKINVPVCVVAGWYDHHLEGTILGYNKLNDSTKANSKLLIGGWNHEMNSCIPKEKLQKKELNTAAHMFNWFKTMLIDERQAESGVETYVVGADKWQKFDKWPIENVNMKYLKLSAQSCVDYNAGKLSLEEITETGTIEYDYNPNNPVYTHGGETLFVSQNERGSLLQEEPGYRNDVISFVSEVLEEDINIAGKITTKLFVSSDCEDTCFTAKIMEIFPNGKAYNIRSSITTLAYRNNSTSRLGYTPGQIVEINIEMLPITWNVNVGSRIRIDISSSCFPEYSIHSNYPGVWSLQDKVKIAHQTIYCGGKYESVIEIPVVN